MCKVLCKVMRNVICKICKVICKVNVVNNFVPKQREHHAYLLNFSTRASGACLGRSSCVLFFDSLLGYRGTARCRTMLSSPCLRLWSVMLGWDKCQYCYTVPPCGSVMLGRDKCQYCYTVPPCRSVMLGELNVNIVIVSLLAGITPLGEGISN